MTAKSVSKSALKQLSDLAQEESVRETEEQHKRRVKRTSAAAIEATKTKPQPHGTRPCKTKTKRARPKKNTKPRKPKPASNVPSISTTSLTFPSVSQGPQSPQLPKAIATGVQPLTSYTDYLNAKALQERESETKDDSNKDAVNEAEPILNATKFPFSGPPKTYSTWLENGRKPYSNKGADKGLNMLSRKLVEIYSRPQRLVSYQPGCRSKKKPHPHLTSLDGRPSTPEFVDRDVDHPKGLATSVRMHGLGTPTLEGTAEVEAIKRDFSREMLHSKGGSDGGTVRTATASTASDNDEETEMATTAVAAATSTTDASLLISQPTNVEAPAAQHHGSNQENERNSDAMDGGNSDDGGNDNSTDVDAVKVSRDSEEGSRASGDSYAYGSDEDDFDDDDFENDDDGAGGSEGEDIVEQEYQGLLDVGDDMNHNEGGRKESQETTTTKSKKSKKKKRLKRIKVKKGPRFTRLLHPEKMKQMAEAVQFKYKNVTREQADTAAECCRARIAELDTIAAKQHEAHLSGLRFRG